jgi:Uma2 family endonuclease
MSTAMSDQLPRQRITVEEYYRMAEAGLLKSDARVELIEGEVIEMAPMGSPHGGTITQLLYLLSSGLGHSAQVRVQMPLRLDDYSEPEPDLAVVLPRKDFYRERHPGSTDTLLVIEVSGSSLQRDRNVKIPLYARHGVPEVWIVDLEHDQLHFYRLPRSGDYTDVSFTAKPGVTALSVLPGVAVDLSDLFGS